MKRFAALRFFALAAVAGALTMPAFATVSVQLNGGAICNDNNAACDSNAAVGVISVAGTPLGTLTINSQDGTSQSPTGAITWTLSGTTSGSTLPPSFTFAISDIGFTTPLPPGLAVKATVGGTSDATSATLSAVGYYSAANTLFNTTGTATATANSSLNGAAGQAFSSTINGAPPAAYSLTEVVTINITALSGTTNKSFLVNGLVSTAAATVPEPASITLLGSALLLAGMGLKRKFMN